MLSFTSCIGTGRGLASAPFSRTRHGRCAGRRTCELVERCPSHQLAVHAGDHIDRTETMIAGKGCGKSAYKTAWLCPWLSSCRRTSSVCPLFADDPTPKKTKPSLTWVTWIFSLFSVNFNSPSECRRGTQGLAALAV